MNPEIRQQKREVVEVLKKKFSDSQLLILTNYRGDVSTPGLTVKEMTSLRRRISEGGGEYKVIKNTLAKIALKELGRDELLQYLVNPTAAVFAYKDPAAAAKAITEHKKDAVKARKHLPVVKAVYMDGKLLKEDDLKRLADLPSKEVLLSMLVSALEGPVQNLANVLSAPMRDLANLLLQVKDQKEEG